MADGFSLRLVADYQRRSGIWRARRTTGQIHAEGTLACGQQPFTDGGVRLPDDANDATRLSALLCERALQLVSRRFDGNAHLQELATTLTGVEIPLAFAVDHERLVDWDGTRLWVSTDVAPALGVQLASGKNELAADTPEHLRGLELALALALFAQLDITAGATLRASLHWAASLYECLGRPDRALLHGVLEGPHLDSGNLLSLFLRRATRTSDLESRDRWVTWIIGQDRIDLPYDRQAAGEVLDSETDVDEKRLLLYGILRGYDHDVEGDNIRRLAAEARAARQQLVFGRMSRAFHNQGTLFADASLLEPGPPWRQLGAQAWELAQGAEALQSAAMELQMLLQGSMPVSLIQMEGACERYEEAALDAQRDGLMQRLHQARARIEDHGDEMARRRPLPAIAPEDIADLTAARLGLVERVRGELLRSPARDAAYVIISQRPSPTGSHLLVKINEFEEPYLGKADNLTKLVRLAGDRVYSSPDYRWLRYADHWIEAIPLFIKEEILIDDSGEETTRTVIDIAGMEESFREEMADHWAENLRAVLQSEYVAAARQQMWRETETAPTEDVETAARLWAEAVAPDDIAAAAVVVRHLADAPGGALQRLVEEEEIEPFEALTTTLSAHAEDAESLWSKARTIADGASWRAATLELLGDECAAEIDALTALTTAPRRPLPVLHVLTTQSAGMTQGYIRTWLEESITLYNVITELGLTSQVEARQQRFRRRLGALGARIVDELGIRVEVEEAAAEEDLSETAAVGRVVGRNRSVQEEVAVLGALLELSEERSGERDDEHVQDPDELAAVIEAGGQQLRDAVIARVVARNGAQLQQDVAEFLAHHTDLSTDAATLQVIESDALYRQDLETFVRFLGRARLLETWAAERGADGDDRRKTYLRRFSRLSKTTARKQVLLERGLHLEAMEPRHRHSAVGGSKRFHLLYTPSRVDLGHRERESVETWAQWVGGADRAAARVGREVYGLINKTVRSYDSLTEPEVLKTGENASMASHFAFSNALSLMVTASAHGDVEEMGDQMSRRRDRIIHPAGEGYGGYCVPKDGLFLEFVLTLGRAEKLQQLGVPGEYHDIVARAAHELLDRRDQFATRFEWEAWAAERLRQTDGVESLFGVRQSDDGPVPVFQLPRLAEVLDGLGQPELRDPERVTTALVARWGIHKMVAGGEHVNRFMPFFKTWLLRRGVAEARRRHGKVAAAPVVVLTAEYKPDTQDGRFAAGMRKFEILCGTGDHLYYALDADGQALASLLSEGFAAVQRRGRGDRALRMLGLPTGVEGEQAIAGLFPQPATPAEIRVVSPTGLSTQDLLGYTSDTRLETIAETARAQLLAAGFSDAEIDASFATFGPHPTQWATGSPEAVVWQQQERDEDQGALHALALQVLGPERTYERSLQGADVLDTGIPHQALFDLLGDPSQIVRLMLEGNADSALVIVDGASGARRRAMNRLDVMLWFAAGERFGREPVYVGIGVGQETVEGWRDAMRRHKRRAQRLGDALRAGDLELAGTVYARIVDEIRSEQEVQQQLAEVDKLRRFSRLRQRDELLAMALARIAAGVRLQDLTFGEFLAIGGVYLLDGAHDEEIESWRRGLARPESDESARLTDHLLHPAAPPQIEDFREEKGLESSNKASEDRPVAALEARRQLAQRVARARALNERYRALESVDSGEVGFDTAYTAALESIGDPGAPVSDAAFGAFVAHARNALFALVSQLYDEDHADDAQVFADHLSQLFLGREISLDNWRQIAGSYEDVGDFGRLAQAVVERDGVKAAENALEQIARGAELFYILLAVETTLPHTRPGAESDAPELWRALADFFAESINDHFYEYCPWVYSRGVGYAHLSGEALYEYSVRHHAWLARYLREVAVRHTEVAELSQQQQDLLLGNFVDGQQIDPIGATGASTAERAWRAYGQLRELAFVRNDGFPLPHVFADFDPDVIDADRRVNHVISLPVGRTHYSRALREGPTLAAELESEGRRGANLIITRGCELTQPAGQDRPIARIHSGHMYVSQAEFADALVRHAGCNASEAAARAAECHPKGVRLAIRFSRPVQAAVVYPFHGDPDYASGRLEDCGLPFSVQSLFHTWTTYDKAKYPDIFNADSGVDVPQEIDWLAGWTQALADERSAKQQIESGLTASVDGSYTGLRAFAQQHRLVMVKDAAESGGRNQRAFVLRKLADSAIDEEELEQAVDFIYQISLRHNVAIQEVIVASPEYWATEEFMDSFVRRQVVEWGSAVERRRRPKSPLYGSHRVIVSTDDPLADVPRADKWHLSHWITLNSKQLITNVGRGGSLEQFLPEFVHERHREPLFSGLADAAYKVMEALSDYEQRTSEIYSAETGRAVGRDLTGASYGTPRYMMLDFLVTPRFAEDGDLVEIRHEGDSEPVFVLQRDGLRFEGTISGWRVVMIEPNIGVGLWDRVALREEFHEHAASEAGNRAFDWDRIGENARIVLRDLTRGGEAYLDALQAERVSPG